MPTGKPALLRGAAAVLSAVTACCTPAGRIDPSAAMFCSLHSDTCRRCAESSTYLQQAAAGHQLHCVVAQAIKLTVLPWLCRKSMTWVAR